METSREEMCKSLTEWFSVFYIENCLSQDQHEKNYLNDLTDGVAMAIALQKLAPDYFTCKEKRANNISTYDLNWCECEIETLQFLLSDTFSKLKIDVGNNWRLKGN